MANYHLIAKVQPTEEWVERMQSFLEELQVAGIELQSDDNLNLSEEQIVIVMDLAAKNHLSLNLMKL